MDPDILLSYVEKGMSTRQIALELNKGQTTIRYWLKKHNLKTKNKSFKDGYIVQDRILRIDGEPIQNCSKCGISLNEETGYWRPSKNLWFSECKKCVNKRTSQRWKNSKKKAVEYKGGKCERCGYNKCIDALEFHHVDPTKKDKNYSNMKLRKWEDQREELDKCICLCSNCHREVHFELRNKTHN